jgi:hypothetical protein
MYFDRLVGCLVASKQMGWEWFDSKVYLDLVSDLRDKRQSCDLRDWEF